MMWKIQRGMIPFTVHNNLYRYLTASRDDFWIDEGDTIFITKIENNWVTYEDSDLEYIGRFPVYFLHTDYDYDEYLRMWDEL